MTANQPPAALTIQQFTVVVDQVPTGEQVYALVERFDDLDLGRNGRKGVGYVHVDRAAGSLLEAIASVVRDLESVGLRPMRVEDDDTVTPGEIADRLGLPRATVALWPTGKHGPGRFPLPLNPGRDTSFYSWTDVAAWLREQMDIDMPEVEPVLTAANLALRLRALLPQIDDLEAILDLLEFPTAAGA